MQHSFLVDFIRGGRLDHRQSFTRPLAAYRTERGGLYSAQLAGQPRIDYDPVTGVRKGVLIEPAATNICPYSQDVTAAGGGWTQVGLTSATSGQAGAPDGTGTVTTLLENTSAGGHDAYRNNLTATVAAPWCFSFFVKYVDRAVCAAGIYNHGAIANYVRGTWNIATGAAIAGYTGGVGNGVFNNSGLRPLANGWRRIWCAGQPDTSGTALRAYVYMSSDTGNPSYTAASKQLKVWGAQLEAGVVPTSYIPTTSGSATRPADVLKQTVGAWWDSAKGTVLVDFTAPIVLSGTQQVLSLDDGTANNRIGLKLVGGVLYANVYVGGTEDVSLNLGAVTAYTDYRIAFAFTASDFSASLNGGAPVTAAVGSVPTITTLRYGCDYADASQLNGHLGRVLYYPARLANATLQALTV